MPEIEIEISVLTRLKPVPGTSDIVAGRDGVLLTKGERSALFLPRLQRSSTGVFRRCSTISAAKLDWRAPAGARAPDSRHSRPLALESTPPGLDDLSPLPGRPCIDARPGGHPARAECRLLRRRADLYSGNRGVARIDSGRRPHRPQGFFGRIRALFLFLAWALPLDVLFLRGSRLIVSGVPGAYLPFPQQLGIMLLSVALIGVPLGLLFQRAARLYMEKGRGLPLAYAAESAGGLLGGLATTLSVRWDLQNFALAVGCAIVCLLPAARAWPAQLLRSSAIILAPILVLAISLSGPIERRTAAWNHEDLLSTRDTPYGRVVVTGSSAQIAVFENDALAFETQDREIEAFSHLPALQHTSPIRDVLVRRHLGYREGTPQVQARKDRLRGARTGARSMP